MIHESMRKMEALLSLLSVEQREAAPRSSEKTDKQVTKSQEPRPSLGFFCLSGSRLLWEASGAVTDSGLSVSEGGIPLFPSIRVALWVGGVYMHASWCYAAPQCFCLDWYTLCEVACISV